MYIEILEYLKSVNCGVHVQRRHIKKIWIFGIDGLGIITELIQDGEKLFNVMLSKKYKRGMLRYNQDHIEEAKQMAIDNQLGFIILQSSRWLDDNDL